MVPYLKVQVRPRGSPCAARTTDRLPLMYRFAFLGDQYVHVPVDRGETSIVAENDPVAISRRKTAGEDDFSVHSGFNLLV